jgi:hypothetical protein
LGLALLGLTLLATLPQQVIRPATRSINPGATERFDLAGASRRVVHNATNPNFLAIWLESDLIPWFDADLVSDRLGDHDLALDADLVSHTASITC